MKRVRVEFRLTMSGCASWDGKWSGAGRNYSVVRTLTAERATELNLLPMRPFGAAWAHHWSDGWVALVKAQIVPPGKRLKKSAGFNGYEWMVSNIIDHGSTKAG
jgi:hypothetical protein